MVKITHHICFIFNCKFHARISYERWYCWFTIIFRKPCSWGNICLSVVLCIAPKWMRCTLCMCIVFYYMYCTPCMYVCHKSHILCILHVLVYYAPYRSFLTCVASVYVWQYVCNSLFPSADSLYGHVQLTLYWVFLYVYHMCCVLK